MSKKVGLRNWFTPVKAAIIVSFYIFNIKVTTAKITYNTTYKLLYNTIRTVPGGAIDHDYPLAFNMGLNNTSKY